MTKLRNPKADILWEATRRNENYKKGYYDALKKYQKKYPDQSRENFKRLPSPDTDRWKINMFGLNPIARQWCTFCWLDPEVTVEEIWDAILERNSTVIHPYTHLFPDERTTKTLTKNLEKKTGKKYGKVFLQSYYCSEMHGIEKFDSYERILEPQNISDDLMLEDFFEFEADNTVYAAIKREYTKDKILLMIDPFETDENIRIKVKEAKNHIIQSIKTTANILRKKGKVLLEPSKMKAYLNWLKKYDEIINKANEESNSAVICIDGAKCLNTENKSVNFGELVKNTELNKNEYDAKKKLNNDANKEFNDAIDKEFDDDTDRRDRADKKIYREAYENSVKLIQQTPNILFLPPKIKA